ncbi:MAG TPA: hypothetical protein VFN61_01980 [Acidimicrobiales bacterium]|nr:hypothetical protein [Acidimicrobiales bacterium]
MRVLPDGKCWRCDHETHLVGDPFVPSVRDTIGVCRRCRKEREAIVARIVAAKAADPTRGGL